MATNVRRDRVFREAENCSSATATTLLSHMDVVNAENARLQDAGGRAMQELLPRSGFLPTTHHPWCYAA